MEELKEEKETRELGVGGKKTGFWERVRNTERKRWQGRINRNTESLNLINN